MIDPQEGTHIDRLDRVVSMSNWRSLTVVDSTGEVLDDGVVPWVGQVLQQVVEGPLAGDVVLDQEPQERQHRQPPCNASSMPCIWSDRVARLPELVGRPALALYTVWYSSAAHRWRAPSPWPRAWGRS